MCRSIKALLYKKCKVIDHEYQFENYIKTNRCNKF